MANGRALSPGVLLEAIEEATGRDLSWLFDAALDASRQFDYGIEAVRTAAQGDTYRTTVVVRRFGSATFPGTGRPPLGRFESGRGVVVEILFADGAVRESWDGRDAQREFMFESRTPPAAAFVDPDLVLLLDENRFNNGWRRHPGEMAVPLRWSLQWMAMLQDFMLLIPAL